MPTFAAILAVFVYGLTSAMLGAFLPTYALDPAHQGSLGLSNALGLIVASLSAGPLADMKGKKVPVVLGVALMALSLLSLARASAYPPLLAVYFLLGLGGGAVSTSANSLISATAAKRRASALNFLNLFFGLGGIVTTFAVSFLFRPAALCYSVAGLALVAILANLASPVVNNAAEQAFQLTEIPRLLAHSLLPLLSLLLFLYVACEVGVWIWLKSYLISIHFTSRTAGGIVSYGFAFGLFAGRAAASRLFVRAAAINVMLGCSVLIAAATFVMLQVHSQTGVTIAVFAAGLAMAPVFPTTLAMVGDQFPRGAATAMGIAITSGWLGLALSSPIVGKLAQLSNLQHALLILPALGCAMVLVNLVLRARLPEPARR